MLDDVLVRLLPVGLTLVTAPLIWTVKNLVQDVRQLHQELGECRAHVAQTYVRRDDIHRELNDIKKLLFGLAREAGPGKGV